MRRGDVYWIRFPELAGRRPAILVSRSEAHAARARLAVVPLTRTVRGIPTEVRLGPADGVPRASVANADEIVTIPRDLMDERVTTLSTQKVRELDDALRFSLSLE